jgi:rhodanese-related sulfurtransferase
VHEQRYQELEKYKGRNIICVCRAGVRSTTAAALLTGLGFPNIHNMRGGMLAWHKKHGHSQA